MDDDVRETNMERIPENEKCPEDDAKEEYRYDNDLFEIEQFFGFEEEESYEDKEWQVEESSIQDWEKVAKKKMHIEIDDSLKRRKTIYDLESYTSSGPSKNGIWKLDMITEPPKPIRYSVSTRMPGIVRIDLSPLTQKIIGCVIGENVSTEYPWIYVKKDVIEDNMELHSESSDFLPVKDALHTFPDEKMLIGYAPSLSVEGQFYIVVTVEGRDAVMRHIQMQKEQHENRVRNAIYKSLGQWYDLGSGFEIDIEIVKNTRPLFEIEVVSTADLLNMPVNLTDRKADDQRDGYIELLPYGQIFENIWRKLISRSTQVTSIIRHNEAQTTPSVPINFWCQYLYEYKIINLSTYTEEKIESLKDFLERYTDDMCNQLLINSTWDIYTNDFENLVRNEKDTQAPVPIGYKEHQSYYDGKIIVAKVINDLCWHPFWTGMPIASYMQHAKSEYLISPKTYDEVFLAYEGSNRVLIWSFTDCLSPKLILECPREVTSITVCPLDGSIIIGGCINGQIAIWHIPGKIEQIETVVTQTSAQIKYSIAMKSLMMWMHKTTETSVIRPVVMSSLKYSQKANITQIVWMSPYHKVDRNGQVTSLPDNALLDELNYQFVTASEDGTIAFWDLKWRPTEKDIRQVHKRMKKIPLDNQKSMTQSASPFKILDRIFKPNYILVIQYPDESRQVVITTISIYNPRFRKIQVEPFPITRDNITIRKYYKSIIEKADYITESKILVGTVEGDFGCITWSGYEFITDVSVNREVAQWLWIKRRHDGPVTHSVRSNYYHQVIATIGGKIFAIWKDDFAEPLVWKKSNVGYTACSWGILRPTILIVGRMDGTIEIWDFIIKSHEPSFTQSLSGRIITGIYTHELPLEPQCIGFCDFNGSLRMFTAPLALLTYDVKDVEWMKKFVDRQVQRISEFKDWQKTWREINPEDIEMKKKLYEMEEKINLKTEGKIKSDMFEATAISTRTPRRKPWQFLEEAKERWMSMEVKRMQRLILEKKGLRKDVLERQREPILRLRQEARIKKRKIREILNLQDRIFDETIAFLFPEQHQERRATLLPPLPVPVIDRRLTIDELIKEETILRPEDIFADPEEEIMYNFLEIQTEVLAKLKSTPFEHTFDWRKVLARKVKKKIDGHRTQEVKQAEESV